MSLESVEDLGFTEKELPPYFYTQGPRTLRHVITVSVLLYNGKKVSLRHCQHGWIAVRFTTHCHYRVCGKPLCSNIGCWFNIVVIQLLLSHHLPNDLGLSFHQLQNCEQCALYVLVSLDTWVDDYCASVSLACTHDVPFVLMAGCNVVSI